MSVVKDENGRKTWGFHGYYRDATGVRRQYHRRGYPTKKEAKEAEHAFLLSMSKVRPSITLDELVHLYHENFPSLGVKEATLISNESYYHNHIQSDLGDVQLSKMTTPLLTQFMSKKAQEKKPDGSLFAVATINKTKEVLSKYLAYAVQLGFLEYNPCHAVPRFKRPEDIPKSLDKMENFWEISTFQYFLSCVDDQNWQDIFSFLFGTGLRIGEFQALQWKDVNLGDGEIRITKSLTSKTSGYGWKITSPKTKNSVRKIDLQSSLVNMLRARYTRESKKDGFSKDFFVFRDARPISRQNVANHLEEYIKKSGAPRITPHGFRHSHASYLIRSRQIDDQLIADRLGHTVEELHRTYAHIYDESRGDLKSVLDKLF